MINLQLWRRYIEGLATDSSLIKRSEIVATKERFLEKTKNLPAVDYPVLLSVIPDARPGTVNEDNVSEVNIMLLFILTPIKRGDFEAEIEFDKWEQTANCCAELKTRLLEDYFRNYQYPFLQEIDFKSLMQQPVWNFEGYMGWCVSFAIEQGGFDFEGYTEEVFTYGEASWEITDRIGVSIDVFNETNVNQECLLFFKTNDSGYSIIQTTIPSRTLITVTQELPFTSNTNQILILDSTRKEIANIPFAFTVFSYSAFSSVYADDIDYNDIISCSLTATNGSLIDQNCTIYFKLGDYLVQQTYLIPALSSHIFTYDFADVDIFVENIVTFHNSAFTVISTVTIPAYPDFEMFFDAQAENMTAIFYFSASDFCDVLWGDGTSDEITLTGGYTQCSSVFAHTYSTTGLKRITFTNPRAIITFRVDVTNIRAAQYYISDISQLRNIEYYYLYASSSFSNVTISKASFRKATKKMDVFYHGNSIIVDDTCFPAIVYSIFTIRYAYNFNASADKLAEIMLYSRIFQIYSASINSDSWTNQNLNINSLIIAPNITGSLKFIYCNLINIERNSDFGDGNVYSFQYANLLNEAIDNALYVLVNTNNYAGASAKIIDLSGQSNGRRTVASNADYNALLALGWAITCYNPNAEPYGYLYNWFVVDTDKIAPIGTHIPTVAEYDTLLTLLGGASVAGGKMKEVGLTNWNTPNIGATNESGYTAIGTGYRIDSGSFAGPKLYNMIWCREEYDATNGHRRSQYYKNAAVASNTADKKQGYCLRCLLDNPSEWVAGDTISDYEGNVYQTVQIGTQVWLASDLRCTKYNNGEPIPHIVGLALWASLTTPGYCSHNNT